MGSPVSFRKPWSSNRIFSHFKSLWEKGMWGWVGSSGSADVQVGQTAPSPVHNASIVAVGHRADQLPEQPSGLFLLQPWATSEVGHCVDMLQQVASSCQLQYQVGALAVLVGLIQLDLANPPQHSMCTVILRKAGPKALGCRVRDDSMQGQKGSKQRSGAWGRQQAW